MKLESRSRFERSFLAREQDQESRTKVDDNKQSLSM